MSDPACECGHTRESHRYESPSPGGWRNCYLCGCEDFRAAGAAKGPIPPELDALARRLACDPRDALTVQALADWVEEHAGDCKPLRELWVGDGDLVVLGHPRRLAPPDREAVDRQCREIGEWFRSRGRDVKFLALPADWTIRQIKAGPARVGMMSRGAAAPGEALALSPDGEEGE